MGCAYSLIVQGNLHVGSVFGNEDSIQLKGTEMITELKYLLHLLTLCWHFSKKPFPLFLEETGFSKENVLLQEPKAGVSLDELQLKIEIDTVHYMLSHSFLFNLLLAFITLSMAADFEACFYHFS